MQRKHRSIPLLKKIGKLLYDGKCKIKAARAYQAYQECVKNLPRIFEFFLRCALFFHKVPP